MEYKVNFFYTIGLLIHNVLKYRPVNDFSETINLPVANIKVILKCNLNQCTSISTLKKHLFACLRLSS